MITFFLPDVSGNGILLTVEINIIFWCLSYKNFLSSCKKSIENIFRTVKMTVQTKIVVAECGYASTPMHPLGPWLLRRAKGIMRSGGIPWRLAKFSVKRRSIRYLDCLLFLLHYGHSTLIDIATISGGSSLTI